MVDEEMEQLEAEVLAMLERKAAELPEVLLTVEERDDLLTALGVSPENVDVLLAMVPIPEDETGVWS